MTPESQQESEKQRARNRVSVRVTKIENGFLVQRGSNPAPYHCKELDDDSGDSVVDKILEFFDGVESEHEGARAS